LDRGAWLWHKSNCHFALAQYEETQATLLLQILQRGATEGYRVHAAYQCAVLQLTTDEKIYGYGYSGHDSRFDAGTKVDSLATV
jgi:hypothetical protein